MAYGKLGLKPFEYYVLAPVEFDLIAAGVKKRDDYVEKANLMNARMISWMIYLANSDPKTRVKSIDEFMPLEHQKKVVKNRSPKKHLEAVRKLEEKLNKK